MRWRPGLRKGDKGTNPRPLPWAGCFSAAESLNTPNSDVQGHVSTLAGQTRSESLSEMPSYRGENQACWCPTPLPLLLSTLLSESCVKHIP